MGIFIRTLVVTLLFCIGYYAWMYFAKEGYSPELNISKEAKNFVVQEQTPKEKEKPAQKPENQLQDVKIAFLTNEGTIKFVTRKAKHKALYTALGLLMRGPSDDEKDLGVFTEIPSNAKLISVKRNEAENSIIINLTKEFGEGGGTQSIQNRIEQIVRTANLYAESMPIYLYLDGKKAQYLGGEGVYIEQPINRR